MKPGADSVLQWQEMQDNAVHTDWVSCLMPLFQTYISLLYKYIGTL